MFVCRAVSTVKPTPLLAAVMHCSVLAPQRLFCATYIAPASGNDPNWSQVRAGAASPDPAPTSRPVAISAPISAPIIQRFTYRSRARLSATVVPPQSRRPLNCGRHERM